jgi:hypothetical protein
MKLFFAFLLMFFTSCVRGKELTYIGSTPATSNAVRSFLGIPFSDSIDFIRWKITMQHDKYSLKCNYGIGKQNTNGFMNDGRWIELSGGLKKEKNYYYLQNRNKTLGMLELNNSLLHLLDENKSLLIGTGGWSYTLSIDPPTATEQIGFVPKQTVLKDSMVFHGRTPCLEFDEKKKNTTCYKLKWVIVLHADSKTNKPTTYFLRGTVNSHKGKTGTWEMKTGKDGRTLCQLNSDNSNPLYFLLLDGNVLAITDDKGKLMIGDEDFSYTLSRK